MITLSSFEALGEGQRALIHDIRARRAAHAVLLTGIPGTGKRTLAHLIACALLCTGEGEIPCMQCKGCRRAMAGTHPDLLCPSCTDKDKTIKVDHLREILRALSVHASEGRRVVLLENAHRMTVQAQNALLKSLEEPDGETTFLLTASDAGAILPTVRSRCRVVRIQPWSPEIIERELKAHNADAARAREIARLCGGSMGTALAMLDNPNYLELYNLCGKSFFSVSGRSDIPVCESFIREKKDDSEELLTLFEQKCREYLLYSVLMTEPPSPMSGASCANRWLSLSPRSLENIMLAIIDGRKKRMANISWQGVSEDILWIIAEEITK